MSRIYQTNKTGGRKLVVVWGQEEERISDK